MPPILNPDPPDPLQLNNQEVLEIVPEQGEPMQLDEDEAGVGNQNQEIPIDQATNLNGDMAEGAGSSTGSDRGLPPNGNLVNLKRSASPTSSARSEAKQRVLVSVSFLFAFAS